ncbi:MAG: hypothetical protein OXH89_01790 [bacterium]|nr:hypothetical protein [bacterium]
MSAADVHQLLGRVGADIFGDRAPPIEGASRGPVQGGGLLAHQEDVVGLVGGVGAGSGPQ